MFISAIMPMLTVVRIYVLLLTLEGGVMNAHFITNARCSSEKFSNEIVPNM
jgi:hypothetical protein